jgi:hypothetical protein
MTEASPAAVVDVTNVTGWRCATCGQTVPIDTVWPWRCPNAIVDRHHVLRIERSMTPMRPVDHVNPFIAFDAELAWAAFARAHGLGRDARRGLVEELDAAIAAVAGVGFTITPCFRSRRLSAALGFSDDGGVWIKDETGNVSGSHKARHLVTILLHLLTAERVGLTQRLAPAARHRFVRQRRAGGSDAGGGQRLADLGVRATVRRHRRARPAWRARRDRRHLSTARR